jgi:D-glycero-alpha-D-manno-heptose-7-phosphate kinase
MTRREEAPGRLYRARAPLRISFCGGGTDVSPYPETKGGVVLSTTLDKFAYASLRPRKDDRLRIQSLDYDVVASYHRSRLEYDGELDLVKAVARHFEMPAGADLYIHTDAPPGSGLGSSSTMCAALVGVFREWLNLPLTNYEIAELTYRIEREELRIAGGRQDQYAATFGGFNFIEFHAGVTVVNPLRVRSEVLSELEYNLLLCYTGQTRLSANIVASQTAAFEAGKDRVVRALDRMKELTHEMKTALLLGDLQNFGKLLHVAWTEKKQLDEKISSSRIDTLYELARRHGALGGKILGAGGGGYLLLFVPFMRKHHVARTLSEAGGEIVPFSFTERGLATWTVAG